jgi:diguanylate cyclase (GGDEF)-like protein
VAVVCLYAHETEFFDAEEMKLLLELAGDIAFALDHISKEERLDYLAYYDTLTGLANLALFRERLAQDVAISATERHKFAVVLIDIVQFKAINDALGRQAGDQVLKRVAARLAEGSGGTGTTARLGADHFAIVLHDNRQVADVGRALDEWQSRCLAEPFLIEGNEVKIAIKAGIAVYPGDGADAEALIKNAEVALRGAKSTGQSRVFYTKEMTQTITKRMSLEKSLREALERDEFVLHYQPKVNVESRRIQGVEALIRWRSPDLGLVPPLKFIPVLEETGMILEVGAWVLRRAVQDHRQWLEQQLAAPRVAVNVSAVQLRRPDFVDVVRDILRQGASPPGIDLEITESLIMDDVEDTIRKLKILRGLGLELAIDDFGTGYSSLGYLGRLPVQALKIDRSFIVKMTEDPDAMTLVTTIISLAHALDLKVVAEGVETDEQATVLRLLRCDEMQGYLISRPVPLEELTPMLLLGGR